MRKPTICLRKLTVELGNEETYNLSEKTRNLVDLLENFNNLCLRLDAMKKKTYKHFRRYWFSQIVEKKLIKLNLNQDFRNLERFS